MKWIIDSLNKKERICMDDVIVHFGSIYPLFKKFKETPQDKEWHSEGDVYIHTDMVISETYEIIENNEFSFDDKLILILAAIFHDICKPVVTKEKEIFGKIRIVAPKHEEMGLSYLFYRFLDENELSDEVKSHTLNLIGYHQKPKMLVIKNKNQWHYKFLTQKTSGYLFYWHQMADMRGRTCNDKDKQIEYIEEFKMFCEEYNCFDNISNLNLEVKNILNDNFEFNSKFDLGYILNKCIYDLINDAYEEPMIAYQRHFENKDNYSKAIIMCGLSGSGKSTFTSNYTGYEVISLDEIRQQFKINNTNRKSVDGKVMQIATKMFKEYLAAKKNVIWDACNIRKDFRDKIVTIAHKYYALTEINFVVTNVNQCIENDNKRSVGHLGKDVILEQFRKFQYVESNEANIISINHTA
jgi:predicted kinase